jgi:hypothetical protein
MRKMSGGAPEGTGNWEVKELRTLLDKPKAALIRDNAQFMKLIKTCCVLDKGGVTQESLASTISISKGYFNKIFHEQVHSRSFTLEEKQKMYDHLVQAKGIKAIIANML